MCLIYAKLNQLFDRLLVTASIKLDTLLPDSAPHLRVLGYLKRICVLLNQDCI